MELKKRNTSKKSLGSKILLNYANPFLLRACRIG